MSAADFSPIDCDFHPVVPSLEALLPYLEDHWRESVIQRGIHKLNSILRHAVEAADIATIRHADAQIVVDTPERIDQRPDIHKRPTLPPACDPEAGAHAASGRSMVSRRFTIHRGSRGGHWVDPDRSFASTR